MSKVKYTCVICKDKHTGFGNNAYPIADGICCNDCNYHVIVARIKNLQEKPNSFNRGKQNKD